MLFCERGIRAPESLYSLNKFYVIPSEAEKKWNLMGVYVPIFFLFISHAKAGMSAETLNQTATLLCEALFKKKYRVGSRWIPANTLSHHRPYRSGRPSPLGFTAVSQRFNLYSTLTTTNLFV